MRRPGSGTHFSKWRELQGRFLTHRNRRPMQIPVSALTANWRRLRSFRRHGSFFPAGPLIFTRSLSQRQANASATIESWRPSARPPQPHSGCAEGRLRLLVRQPIQFGIQIHIAPRDIHLPGPGGESPLPYCDLMAPERHRHSRRSAADKVPVHVDLRTGRI